MTMEDQMLCVPLAPNAVSRERRLCRGGSESYCGARQALRLLADDSIAEHNMRRALMRRIVSKSVELQLCDLSGACSTQALLDLGPQEKKPTLGGGVLERNNW